MKMDKAAKAVVIVFFAVLTMIGFSCTDDYGLPVSALEWQDAAVFAPLASVQENHQPHEFKTLCQSYTWLLFMLGLYALYGFSRETGMGRIHSCMGVLTVYFCPRFYAEGHYSREMVLLALLLCVLWLGVRFAKKPGVLRALWFALASALAANLSQGAVLLWIALMICAAVPLMASKGWTRRTAAGMICAAASFAVLLRAVSPARPGMVDPRPVLYAGKTYDPAVQALPWLAPVWMLAVTLPLFAFPLFGCGQLSCLWQMWVQKRKALRDPISLALAATTLCWLGAFAAGIFCPAMNHVWQLRCFLYAGFAIMMARGVMGAYRFGRHFGGDCGMHLVFVAGLLLFFGWTARDMDRNHPYGYAYFNRIAHNTAVRQMELDRENVSAYNALKKLAQSTEGKTVRAVDALSQEGLEAAYELLPPADKARITLAETQDADYLYANTTYFRISRSRVPRGYHKLFDLKCYDLIISTMYEKR